MSNMADASNNFAGKVQFIKLDCSQVYHCVQMAYNLSTHFNCSSRTHAYKCLAQELSKSVTGFSSFSTLLGSMPSCGIFTKRLWY